MMHITKKLSLGGFSLMELLAAVAIVAILATVAVYTYQKYVLKGYRIQAQSTLISLQLAEESYRSKNSTYATLAQLTSTTTVGSGRYTLSTSGVSGTAYTLQAAANSSQSGDSEDGVSCATLVITVTGGVATKTPSACWLN